MKPPPISLSESEWRAILGRIFFHTGLERTLDTRKTSLIEALGEMGELDTITRASLAPDPVTAPVPEIAAPSSAISTDIPAYLARPHRVDTAPPEQGYRTSRREYQSALGNQGLIEALLRFHRRAGRPASFSSATGPKGGFEFEPELIPEVKTEAKNGNFRRAPGVAVPVLRTKKEP